MIEASDSHYDLAMAFDVPGKQNPPHFPKQRSPWGCVHCSNIVTPGHDLTGRTRKFEPDIFIGEHTYGIENWVEVSHLTCPGCKGQALVIREFEKDDAVGDFKQVYPAPLDGPEPHTDLPSEVEALYLEARSVAITSPRSASVLLRLALETFLGGSPFNLSGKLIERIAEASKLPELTSLFTRLEVVRIVGNEAAHESIATLTADPELVLYLFEVINEVAEAAIATPRRHASMAAKIPATKQRKPPQTQKCP